MRITTTLPFIVCLIGVIVWFVCTIPRGNRGWVEGWLAEAGKIAFAFGLLALLLLVGGASML